MNLSVSLPFSDLRHSVGLLGPLPVHKQKKRTHARQTSVPCVGFEPRIPASERAKTVHALDRLAMLNFMYLATHWPQDVSYSCCASAHCRHHLQLNSEVLQHSACSPDQASSDYDLFCPPRGAVRGRHVASDQDLREAFHGLWLNKIHGSLRACSRWINCVERDWDCIVKWCYCTHSF
jgi:hypothetical protein